MKALQKNEPFYWEYLSPEDAARRTAAALEWFDMEVLVAQERAASEARIRKIRRQSPRPRLDNEPDGFREAVAEIVCEILAQELPDAMQALRMRHGA